MSVPRLEGFDDQIKGVGKLVLDTLNKTYGLHSKHASAVHNTYIKAFKHYLGLFICSSPSVIQAYLKNIYEESRTLNYSMCIMFFRAATSVMGRICSCLASLFSYNLHFVL